MREYVIFTDSSADLDIKMVEECGLDIQPLTFNLDGTSYENWPDERSLSSKEFYAKLRTGSMSSTSQVNVAAFVEAFKKILDAGKDVLYLGFSSALSGTVHSGVLAAEELAAEYPDAKVLVVDTLAASLGQGLLVWHAVQKKREGMSIEELASWVEENKLKMAHWFTVNDLGFLKRGGRVSGTAAMLGTMLNIKPVMHVDDAGRLIPKEKVRGRKQSLNALLKHMEETGENLSEQTVFISHGDCLEEAQELAETMKQRFGVQDVYINYVGPVIGSHSGPGTMAIFFFATGRE